MPFWDDLDSRPHGRRDLHQPRRRCPEPAVRDRVARQDLGRRSKQRQTSLNFGVIFNENSSTIEFRYPDTNTPSLSNGASATVGVQNSANAGQFTQYSHNSAVITSGLVLRGTLGAPSGCAPVATGQCTTPLFADVPPGHLLAAGDQHHLQQHAAHHGRLPREPAQLLPGGPRSRASRWRLSSFAPWKASLRRRCARRARRRRCTGCIDIVALLPVHHALEGLGLTSGCGGGNYCPAAITTREQMARSSFVRWKASRRRRCARRARHRRRSRTCRHRRSSARTSRA